MQAIHLLKLRFSVNVKFLKNLLTVIFHYDIMNLRNSEKLYSGGNL